jgi:hypothetical protein
MYAFTGRNALLSGVSAIDDSQEKPPRAKKILPRRVTQEGFMAASVCRHEQTNVE